jgi:hypothetical protein
MRQEKNQSVVGEMSAEEKNHALPTNTTTNNNNNDK